MGKVELDPTFAQTVNMASDYHVFLTPEGDCRGLYISHKTAVGFEVHEFGGGQSNVAFDYRDCGPATRLRKRALGEHDRAVENHPGVLDCQAQRTAVGWTWPDGAH